MMENGRQGYNNTQGGVHTDPAARGVSFGLALPARVRAVAGTTLVFMTEIAQS